jgi:hypothetical protein
MDILFFQCYITHSIQELSLNKTKAGKENWKKFSDVTGY